MSHKETLEQLRKDLDKMKRKNLQAYELSEVHLSVVAREIHQRRIELM